MNRVANRTSFMALMIHDYAEQLEMPSGFVKRMGRRRVEGEYRMRVWGCGGSHCWIVKLEKDRDGLFFRNSWPEFVMDNNLGFADVLMFIYEGSNKFLVKIFDPSGLKRNMVLTVRNEEEVAVEIPIVDDEESDVELMNMDQDEPPTLYVDSEGDCHLEVGGEHEEENKGFMEPSREEGLCRMEIEKATEKEEPARAEPTREKLMDCVDMNGEKDLGSIETTPKGSLFRFADVVKENNKEASALPPFSSNHTHFIATWSPTWQHYLTIPKEIAVEKDLHSKSQLVVRDPTGNTWFMKLSKAEDGSVSLTGKWRKFYEDFKLKEGDTCTVEFTYNRIVHVHISASGSKHC
ncbi:unnamed protein product [Rhodiola kirilowii]